MPASGADDPSSPTGQHYFSPRPDSRSRPSTVRLELPDRSVELHTDRGVFSPDRVDPGTTTLLAELLDAADPADGAGVVVDLGAGYGPIACTMALRHPRAQVLAVEVNERARALCAANAARLGVEIEVCAPDEVPSALMVDHLVSNPPIRIGKAALHDLLSDWLDRVTPSGVAHLVVRRQLGADSLAEWLRGRGHEVRRLRSRQGYRVLEVDPVSPSR